MDWFNKLEMWLQKTNHLILLGQGGNNCFSTNISLVNQSKVRLVLDSVISLRDLQKQN